MNVILRGVVGSHAYGLDTPESDVDMAGIYAVDTDELFKLEQPPLREQSIQTHDPDLILHEASKFCRLALRCNPSVLELLWLGKYEECTPLGYQLIVLRNHFLAAPLVKGAYLGYANEQMLRLQSVRSRFDERGRQDKMAKHARHVARLLFQGYQLYRTSTLPVKLPYPHMIRRLGDWAAQGDLEPLKRYFGSHVDKFNNNTSPLPDEPDARVIDNWLYEVRMSYLPGRLRKPRLGDLLTDDLTQPRLTDHGVSGGNLGLDVEQHLG